jgi:hypothetical protein
MINGKMIFFENKKNDFSNYFVNSLERREYSLKFQVIEIVLAT